MNLPLLHMASSGQYSGSLEFTEGWGFPHPSSVSLNRFQSSIFHAWVAGLNVQICYQLQGVWAYSCWLKTLRKTLPWCTRSCFSLLILLGDPRLKVCLKKPLSWHSLLSAASLRLCSDRGLEGIPSSGLQCWILPDEDTEEFNVLG